MQLLVLILNQGEKAEPLFREFIKIGIRGATILDSMGMVRALHRDIEDIPLFGSLKMLVNGHHPLNKTILVVLRDDQVSPAIEAVRRIVGDLSKPDVGILFTIPVNYVEGLLDSQDKDN